MTANAFLEEAKSEGIVRCVVGAVIAKASTVLLLAVRQTTLWAVFTNYRAVADIRSINMKGPFIMT